MGASILNANSDGEASMTTGRESHEETMGSLKKIPFMNRSIKYVPCSELTAKLEIFPNQAIIFLELILI